MNYDEIELAWAPLAARTPGLDQVYAYLAARGIDKKLAGELGFHIIPAQQLISKAMGNILERTNPGFRENRLAIVIPHRPYSQWWCARLIDVDVVPKAERVGWERLIERTTGRAKMFAPPGQTPDAYLVPTLDWTKLPKKARVHIHESAIKAVNGARLGYWSVGLNGVWGWSKKGGKGMAPVLAGLPWRKLELVPVIVYDSNYEDNYQVQAAAEKLAERLMAMTGRKAEVMHTPRRADGGHRGFDDFCVEEGDEVAIAWLNAGGEEAELDPVRLGVIELNDRVCLVESLSRIAEIDSGVLMSRHEFCDVKYSDMTVYDIQSEKTVSIPKAWMTSPWRTKVRALAYTPGDDRITRDGDLNLWRGMGVEPKEGNVKPWLDLIADSIPVAHRQRVIQWFAYPLQNPGCKMNTALLLYGKAGTGKDGVLTPIKAIYGDDNSVEVSDTTLKSSFNSVYSAKQFIHANELERNYDSQGQVNQTLKMVVTSAKMLVNRKGQPEYTIDNVANLAITSNYADCVKMDEDDRRLYIHEWKSTHRGPEFQEYWNKYFTWAKSVEGAQALYAYLLGVDMKGFDPMAWAPETDAKEYMRGSLRSPLDEWVYRLKSDPDSGIIPLPYTGQNLFTSEELASIYCSSVGDRGACNSIKMGKACFKQLEKTGKLRLGGRDDESIPYWIVRGDRQKFTNAEGCRKYGGRKVTK